MFCRAAEPVRVEGMQTHPQYNALEGVVLELAGDTHVCVCLDQDNTKICLKLQDMRLMVITVNERKELYTQVQDLKHERIATCRKNL